MNQNTSFISSQPKKLSQNGRGLSRFCAIFGAKWDCPPLCSRFEIISKSSAVCAPTRREVLGLSLCAGMALTKPVRASARVFPGEKALVAISLDLEMSRHYPTWDQTHWDYEKGNLDWATKRYAVEAARRVKAKGGMIHFFALGQTMEQEDVGWLKEIVGQGHPVGNHTYDHVNVKEMKKKNWHSVPAFPCAPWLIAGKTPSEVITANIRLAESAFKERIGLVPAGFRTPGGFSDGLTDRPDLQTMLLKLGFTWVSSKYPAHPLGTVGQPVEQKVLSAIVEGAETRGPGRYYLFRQG